MLLRRYLLIAISIFVFTTSYLPAKARHDQRISNTASHQSDSDITVVIDTAIPDAAMVLSLSGLLDTYFSTELNMGSPSQ